MKRNEQKQNRKRLNSQKTTSKLPPLNKKTVQPDKATNLTKISHQDQGIVGLLYEYFIKNNFLDSLDSFQKQCFDKGFKPNNKLIQGFRQQLIEAFQQGNRENFVNRFNQFVPISMRVKDLQTMKLQFYIQVYFFVYSIHPQLGRKRNIDNASKQAFVSYLQGKGATLAKSNQFLQYYALAYLPKPQQHPTFKTIFTRQWIGELKKRVIYFTQKLYPIGRIPMITSMYDKYIQKNMEKSGQFSQTEDDDENYIQQEIESEQAYDQAQSKPHQNNSNHVNTLNQRNSGEISKPYQTDRQRQVMSLKIAELQEQKNQLIKFIESMKNKEQTLQNKYKQFTSGAHNILMQSQTKWFKITQQFYNIANNLLQISIKFKIAQQIKPLSEVDINKLNKIEEKLQKYQSFIHMNIEDLISENIDFSMFERPDYDVSTDLVRKNTATQYGHNRSNMIQINFDKVKEVLLSEVSTNNQQQIIALQNDKCDLLEALKWRIIKTRGIMPKREAVLSLVLADIFNFSEGKNLLSHLLQPVINGVQTNISTETILRIIQLINALAKDYYGREYLTRQSTLTLVIDLLKTQSPLIPQTTKSLLILTLQQLSIKSQAQIIMINKDVIAYIINKLSKQHETMPQFLMQYCTALLINLLLRKQGCTKSQQTKQQILQTLINLMEVESTEVRQYVHGTLYPLFSKKVFREKAKQYGMEENIKYLLQNTDVESLIHQLNYLKTQLLRQDDDQQPQVQGEGDGQQDTDDITDQQYGQDFEIQGDDLNTGLTGQDLLLKKYSLTGPDAIGQLNAIRQQAENTLKKKSVYMANSFSDRPGTNNPVLQMRRNASHNNSVYSNKSSNRILRSELNNRSQLQTSSQNRINNGYSKKKKQKLDTVQPDNSEKEMSIKDFINENNIEEIQDKNQKQLENRDLFSAGNKRVTQSKGESRQGNDSRMQGSKQRNIYSRQNKTDHLIMDNQSFSQSQNVVHANNQPIINGSETNINKSKQKYEHTQQYQKAFVTRAKLVRTPPQKN